jgi:hypothetical protein
MTDQPIVRPPAELLGEGRAPPEVTTLIAEVRSDASLSFDPLAAPNYLVIPGVAFGALIMWRVDVSWTQAEQIQSWLMGAPPAGAGLPSTRLEALKRFFELDMEAGTPPKQFLDFVGIYLATGLSHAQYTLVLGMRHPFARAAYQNAFDTALSAVLASPTTAGWGAEIVDFLKLVLNQPSSREEFLTLSINVRDAGDPSATPPRPTVDWPPRIRRLV